MSGKAPAKRQREGNAPILELIDDTQPIAHYKAVCGVRTTRYLIEGGGVIDVDEPVSGYTQAEIARVFGSIKGTETVQWVPPQP